MLFSSVSNYVDIESKILIVKGSFRLSEVRFNVTKQDGKPVAIGIISYTRVYMSFSVWKWTFSQSKDLGTFITTRKQGISWMRDFTRRSKS